MADNPYAEFQQKPVEEEEQVKTQTQKSAVTAPSTTQTSAAGDPYAEFKKPTAVPEEAPPGPTMLGKAEEALAPVGKAITDTLAPNPENYSSLAKTNAIEVPKTLGRGIVGVAKGAYGAAKSLLPESIGGGGALGHAFTDPITPEEESLLGYKPGEGQGTLAKVGAGIGRLGGTLSMGQAAHTYADPATRPTTEQALEVLPEALGEGAGNVLAFEGAGKAVPKVVSKLGSVDLPTVKSAVTAPVRAAGHVLDIAKNHPEVPGAAIGAVTHGPSGALEGAATGGVLGKATRKIPNTAIDAMKEFGKKAVKEKGVVGNEYTPKTTEAVPPAKEPGLGRIEYAEPTEAGPTPERVGNEYTPEATEPTPKAKEPSKLGRVEYGEPTAKAEPKEESRVGNEYTPETTEPTPKAKEPSKLGRIEYGEQSKSNATNPDLVGNEHTEGNKESPEITKKHPLSRIEYAEPTSFTKEIKPEDVKSSPGTSMAKEEPAPKAEETKAEKFEPSKIIDDFNTSKGRAPVKTTEAAVHPKGKEIADAYDAMKHDPTDPAVKKSYDSLKKDINEQWDHAEKSGVNFEPWNKEGQPYKNSKEMAEDVKNNKHLYFFQGGDLPEGHPMAEVDPNTGYTANDKFRAVHDLFGHAAHGFEFGPKGEEGAYNVHAQTLSPESIPALTSETRGQNNWVNFGKHMRNAAGEVLKKGDEGYVPPAERPFAEQKAGILPEEFHAKEAKPHGGENGVTYSPEEVVDHIKSGKDFAVLQAENPQNTRLSPEENAKLTKQLKEDLIDKGYNPVEVGGNTKDVEGVTENAFFVPDITPADAAELGRKYKQQGILTSEGLHDLNKDTVNPIKRDQELLTGDKARAQQYFTTIGNQDFNVPLDFDKTVKPGEAHETTSPTKAAESNEKSGEGTAEEKPEASAKPVRELTKEQQEELNPEDSHPEVEEQVANLSNADLKKLGEQYGLDPKDYDFSKREALREGGSKHPVERYKFVKDMMEAMPDEEQDTLSKAVRGMKDEGTFDDAAKSSKGRAEAAKGVFPKLRSELNMKAEAGGPKASMDTAKMSDEELKKQGFTQEEIDKGRQLPKAGGGAANGEQDILPEEATKHMTEDERAGLKTDKSKQTFVDKLTKLPSVQEFVDIAQQGEGGRKWYQRGTKAFDAMVEEAPDYFKEGDRDKFIDLLASTSPQQTVTMNLKESLNAWRAYVDEGRPTGKPLEKLLRDNLTLPDAKVPNAMKSLAGEELWPDLSKNSNFKVPSFSKNLKEWLSPVTNDGWMALFGGMKASELQRPTGYHPLTVATRAAAEALGWEPAEAQAAIWAFTKAFTEHGETDPSVIRQYSEDFADIMAHDPEVRSMLKDLGVSHDNLDAKLQAIGDKPEITGRTTPSTEDSVRKLGERIKGAGRDLPRPKDQRSLNLTEAEPVKPSVKDKDTEFNPEELSKEEGTGLEEYETSDKEFKKGTADRSTILVKPDGKAHFLPEYTSGDSGTSHAGLLRKLGAEGGTAKFLEDGGVRAYTQGPEEAGIEIRSTKEDTVKNALRLLGSLNRENSTFEISNPSTYKTELSARGTYEQIRNKVNEYMDEQSNSTVLKPFGGKKSRLGKATK